MSIQNHVLSPYKHSRRLHTYTRTIHKKLKTCSKLYKLCLCTFCAEKEDMRRSKEHTSYSRKIVGHEQQQKLVI